MKRKLISLFLCLVMTLAVFGSFAPADTQAAAAKLNKKSVTLYVGETVKLKLKGAESEVSWKTSKKAAATVKKGKVTAKKPGTATITATCDGKKYKCKVTIKEFENGFDAVENMKIGINLGNYFDVTLRVLKGKDPEAFMTGWGNPVVDASLFTRLKELGFGAVRLPVTWMYHFDEDGNIDPEWMGKVREVVEWILGNDMYCIINIHHDTGATEGDRDKWLYASMDNFKKNNVLFSKLWAQIAGEFKDCSEKLLFEGFNEMLDEKNDWVDATSDASQAINEYNQLFVNTVRKTGGKNITRNLICNTYAATISESALYYYSCPNDKFKDHIIGQVHFYQPYEFAEEEGVTWTKPIKEYNAYVEESVDAQIAYIGEAFTTRGPNRTKMPAIIGEFATKDKNNTADRIKWFTRVISDAKEWGMTCFIWDDGTPEHMGYIDRVGTNDPFPEIIEACIKAAQ
ncbi:MAG: cellulase family glycosylhydrolase [Lachnospiraceae bacterium]|nr:cellulase family glycosylhydrolase [Lachnospiraceae bacterium]